MFPTRLTPSASPKPASVPTAATTRGTHGPAEQKLAELYGSAARNFLEENDKLYKKKTDKINAHFDKGKAAIAEAETQIMVEMHRLQRELAGLQSKKAELEKFKQLAVQEAAAIKEASAQEYLKRHEAQVKQHIDAQLRPS